MKKKAIILDLDNTIFPTKSIGDVLFKPLVDMIRESGFEGDIGQLKEDVMRKPFQHVAEKHKLPKEVVVRAHALLAELRYDGPIQHYSDYPAVRDLPLQKHLVTSGYTEMQWSKIRNLDIEKDFSSIQVVDRHLRADTKADAFRRILDQFSLAPGEVVVIGDDPESELAAGMELGTAIVLYDSLGLYGDFKKGPRITDFHDLPAWL